MLHHMYIPMLGGFQNLRQTTLAGGRDLWCPDKRICSEGENTVRYHLTCKLLFLDKLTPELQAEIPN